jgi:hypothetical protein
MANAATANAAIVSDLLSKCRFIVLFLSVSLFCRETGARDGTPPNSWTASHTSRADRHQERVITV